MRTLVRVGALAVLGFVAALEPPAGAHVAFDRAQQQEEGGLLEWWSHIQPIVSTNATTVPPRVPASSRVLVGVKSAALHGFESRQVIRQTWASPTVRPREVHVVFLTCSPDLSTVDPQQREDWRLVLDAERSMFADVLADELKCVDSYWRLVDKFKGFARWLRRAGAHLKYAMLVDDDVYVELDALVRLLLHPETPRQRFYAGQVLHTQFGLREPALRDPAEKNYLPYDNYPLREKPPFATGAHEIFSFDLIDFVARNADAIQGMGTLEDASIGFWLLALIGVRPIHLRQFDNVRFTPCHNNLIAYADISRNAIRLIYANRLHGRAFCVGFSFAAWDKRGRHLILPESLLTGSRRTEKAIRHDWEVFVDPTTALLKITIRLTAEPDESIFDIFTPSVDAFATFCALLLERAQQAMPTTAFHRDYCYELRYLLEHFLTSATAEDSRSSHLYALSISNLRHGSTASAVFVLLLPGALQSRTLIECLMASIYPDAHVFVLDEEVHALRYSSIQPCVVFGGSDDFKGIQWAERFSSTVRTVVLSSPSLYRSPGVPCLPASSIVISSTIVTHSDIYLPLASQSFARRRSMTPLALLATSNSNRSEQDVVAFLDCSSPGTLSLTVAKSLISALQNEQLEVITVHCSQRGAFDMDNEVEQLREAKFALIVEDEQLVPGSISSGIVSAFLAGAVPIYYGHSPTARWLFNPRAFIDCGSLPSLSACARRVSSVVGSFAQFESMRQAPPVVNTTAFTEVFSWHPDVISSPLPAQESSSLIDRLRNCINQS